MEASMKTVMLTRESVSAGDDINAPHFREIDIEQNWKIERILNEIVESQYLPLVAGGATWSVAIHEPIAVISQKYPDSIKLITLPDFPYQKTKGFVPIRNIHFNYHAQQNPDVVLEVLERFNLNK